MGRTGTGVKAASKTSIEISFYFDGIKRRERLQLKPTAVNLDRAAKHREDILDAIAAGAFDYATTFPNSKFITKDKGKEPETLTLGIYLDQWLADKTPQIKTSTFVGYRKIVAFINPKIGDIPLNELKRKQLSEFARSLDGGNKRISNILSVLRSALSDAVHHEIIDDNPLAGWSYRKAISPKKQIIDPFTREEQAVILAEMRGQHHNLIKFAFWTGLRSSELCAIEWGDVDWFKNTIRIERAKTQDADEDESTKTISSIREVKLLAPALEALGAQKAFTFLEGNKIFHNPRTNAPWTGEQPIRRTCWIPALKKSGVRYRKAYQTRHTFASMMLSSGETLAWVSRMLGHSNVLQTARAYATWIPDTSPEAGLKAVELFASKQD